MSKTFSQGDVAAHNKPTDLFVVIDEDVYDLTKFQDEHPGRISQFAWNLRILELTTIRRQEDPQSSSRQGRLEAVLEVSQRGTMVAFRLLPDHTDQSLLGHPQEVQSTITGRILRLEKASRASDSPSYSSSSEERSGQAICRDRPSSRICGKRGRTIRAIRTVW